MRLVSIPANPVPENVVAGEIKTPDRVSLRFARWAPPPGRKGTVCLFLGRTEFIEKYFETVRDLRARGFAVAILDWRGQGLSQRLLSDPLKGHVRDFADYDLDLSTFMKEVVLPDCPPPHYALAHSMGAAVLIRAAHEGHRWFDRIVLSAPMIALPGLRNSVLARAAARALRMVGMGGSYVPARREETGVMVTQPFAGNVLTSDPVRYARTCAVLAYEPALALGLPTVTWTNSAFRVMRDFAEPTYPARIRQPILIIAAGRDQVVATRATEDFAIQLRAGSHVVVPGALHELLMEQDRMRAQFWAAFDAFVPGSPLY
jgi:lysophospholipase